MRLKLWTLFAALATLCFVGCSYDDTEIKGQISNLEDRVTTLEQLCQQMNTNITSLQTIVNALQQQDYITSVTPIKQGDTVIGYTINFAKNDPITIYHGKDGANGANGANGADGYVPQIGVAKDETDGLYYWTLDGEWLTDAEGNKVRAQGLDGGAGNGGSEGEAGEDGKDGVTPQLKIKLNYWYVSYDNGATWERLGPATGYDGADGKDGDSFFKNVEVGTDYITFVLADGTTFTVPTQKAFEDLEKRVEKLESNVKAIQDLLSDKYYIKDWGTLTNEENSQEVIGYWFELADYNGEVVDTIKIYHGEDGNTPVIGVEEENGIYYWTVDGEFVLDDSGAKIPVTGNDGEDGKPGQDGKTPEFKIVNGHLWVKFDGHNWKDLGNVKGDDGKNGDSFFKYVNVDRDGDYIILTLNNKHNTEIKIPTWQAYTKLQNQLKALQDDVNSLKAQVKGINELLAKIRENKVIKDVKQFSDQTGSGWKITMINLDGTGESTITIYNGKNGQDGKTPQIGVKKAEDGVYYWTLNGQWLTDARGNKIPVTGPQGDQGQPGQNGQNGVTPMFAFDVENHDSDTKEIGDLFVSYDNGETWVFLLNIRGPQGEPGASGAAGINVTTDNENGNYVITIGEQSITVPQYKGLAISFVYGDEPVTNGAISVYENQIGEQITINFDVTYCDDTHRHSNLAVEAIADDWDVEATLTDGNNYCGTITVTIGDDDDDQAKLGDTEKVIVFITDGNGNTTMATLKIKVVENPVPPLKVGDIYNDESGNALGVIYYIDNEKIKIVAMSDIRSGNSNTMDWNTANSAINNLAGDWEFPTVDDWDDIYEKKDAINDAISGNSNDISGTYWAKNQYYSQNSGQLRHKIYNTSNGQDSDQTRNTNYKARAIMVIER